MRANGAGNAVTKVSAWRFCKGGERAQRVGPFSVGHNLRLQYLPFQRQDHFLLEFGMYFTPTDFRFVKRGT